MSFAEFIGGAFTWILTTLSEFGMWVIADIWHVVIFTGIILAIIAIVGLIKYA